MTQAAPGPDMVNHPPHYQTPAGIEAINVIEQYGLGFHLGNAMKYLLRAGRKGCQLEDLRKAEWYLSRWLACVEDDDAGVAYADPINEAIGGVAWRTPDAIVAAFGLTGSHQAAALLILESAACSITLADEIDGIANARDILSRAITDLVLSEKAE